MTANGRPCTVITIPAVPLTSAGCSSAPGSAPSSACLATAAAPWITFGCGRAACRHSRSGARRRDRAARQGCRNHRHGLPGRRRRPPARCRARSGSGAGICAPLTRRLALLASCRVASGDRPTMGAISSKGSWNMSCSTNASRSAGARVSSTTRRARPTESASSASSSGWRAPLRADEGIGEVAIERLLASGAARSQDVQTDAGDDGGQPAAKVLNLVGTCPTDPKPGVLDGVVRLRQRTEHPVGDRPQMRPVFLEAICQPLVFVHRSHPPVAACHSK